MTIKTREQIGNEHKVNVQNIRASYFERQEISHEEYHVQLNAESERHEAELATNFPPEPPRDLAAEVDEMKVELAALKKAQEGT